uniref:Integrase, catalytic region, zinc finger, CCHC-type, peptidase aspartic, catalytic n=1 Tax=Tanacetum cinerariifolium TaxID=118510 RepID=A0A699GTQ7_TANCI|nr:integrase, catalytic region, zinc finger, CCHC-type, peptidase aspartic, catalytic [Tanacetum cinerariifolium]
MLKDVTNNSLSSRSKGVESNISNNLEPSKTLGSNVSTAPFSSLIDFRLSKLFSGTVRFGYDQIEKIIGLGDYQMGNVMISWVYYVEGLGHNLFFVGQFCDSNLEVAFRKHTCHIWDLEDVDLHKGSWASIYTLCLCEDLVKLKPKEDAGIFVGYAHAKKAYRIYNNRTRLIIETIYIDFDELRTIASEQFSLGPGPQLLTPRTLSSGLVPNPLSPTSYVPPIKKDWDILFKPMSDEYFNPLTCVSSLVPTVPTP